MRKQAERAIAVFPSFEADQGTVGFNGILPVLLSGISFQYFAGLELSEDLFINPCL